ncbi:MAG: hypothetical protein SFW62_07835 [Alphaproteobacteria bacterium]|nr:hypothetical protein [Alphaproteobacteria bacterium]
MTKGALKDTQPVEVELEAGGQKFKATITQQMLEAARGLLGEGIRADYWDDANMVTHKKVAQSAYRLGRAAVEANPKLKSNSEPADLRAMAVCQEAERIFAEQAFLKAMAVCEEAGRIFAEQSVVKYRDQYIRAYYARKGDYYLGAYQGGVELALQ